MEDLAKRTRKSRTCGGGNSAVDGPLWKLLNRLDTGSNPRPPLGLLLPWRSDINYLSLVSQPYSEDNHASIIEMHL